MSIALLFFLSGLAFIGKTGIHFDAAYEIGGIYSCCAYAFKPVLFGYHVPIMVLPYLGAFKTWIYAPLLRYFEVTPFLLRLPSLLVGTASIVLFFVLLDRTIGRRGAITGALLLATDAVFVIATTYDFGPMAFLHFFLLAAILLLLDFERTPRYRTLALAFFLLGLATWHKALFIWMLDGLIVAAIVVFRRRVFSLVTLRRLAVGIASFCCGALPLIWFNIVISGATLRTNEVMAGRAPFYGKLIVLKKTMSGSVFFGWMIDDAQPSIHDESAAGVAAKASIALSDLLHGRPRSNGIFYVFLAACALLPWLWFTPFRKAAMFVFVYLATVWLQMIALPNTGAALHHVLLLWPFPHFLIAIAAASIARWRAPLWVAITIAMTGSNLLLLNQCFASLTTNGTTTIWTDAIYPLYDYLDSHKAGHVVVTDWGYSTTLCVFSDGSLPFQDISYALLGPSDAQIDWLRSLIGDPKNVFVEHAPGSEQFVAATQRFAWLADQTHRRKEVVAVIKDRNQRPRFEIVRYAAVP